MGRCRAEEGPHATRGDPTPEAEKTEFELRRADERAGDAESQPRRMLSKKWDAAGRRRGPTRRVGIRPRRRRKRSSNCVAPTNAPESLKVNRGACCRRNGTLQGGGGAPRGAWGSDPGGGENGFRTASLRRTRRSR